MTEKIEEKPFTLWKKNPVYVIINGMIKKQPSDDGGNARWGE